MVNEISIGNEWIDTDEWVRKDVSKVTEQDVKRAQWDSAKAKKAQEEIKKNKAENNNIAKFLEFLLKNIKNEELISAIYNTFFKVINPKTQEVYLRKSVNNIIIIWFFAPFFLSEIEKFSLKSYFEWLIIDSQKMQSLNEYIEYIKKLSRKYHDNIPINKESLLNLLALITWVFGLSKDALTEVWREKIIKDIEKRLK